MLEHEPKNKMANTISRYKLKCNQLEDEINVLKRAISQLSLTSDEIQVSLGKRQHHLLANLNDTESQQVSHEFTNELQNTIRFIQQQIQYAKSKEDLSNKLNKSFAEMLQKIRCYREKEQQRIKKFEDKISALQNKLAEAECGVEIIRHQLSFHSVRRNHDSVTGLPNQTAYDEYILSAFHRWQRGFGDLSLAIAAVDSFKEINKKYGGVAADEILKTVASIFKSSIRAADFIAHYDGKFIFIFERTSAYDAAKVLENLRTAIEESDLYYRDIRVKITLSFGLTALQHGDTLVTLLDRANEAMQKAKQNGCNQVVTL